MPNRSARSFAPASISNLGPGFDVFGVALERPGDFASARRTKDRGLFFSVSGRRDDVPSDVSKNVAAYVSMLLLDEACPPFGVALNLTKMMPVGSGLGSSAASSVAALVAVNTILPKPLQRIDLLRFAAEGERLATGSPHADNVAPSLLGGMVIVRSTEPLDVISVSLNTKFRWVVVHPHVIVRTKEARAILPQDVPLARAVRQWGNASGLVAGLISGREDVVRRCMEDLIVEPVRSKLIPAFEEVRGAAHSAGALGCTISGSGPSMVAVVASEKVAQVVARTMRTAFREAGVESDAYISKTNVRGARIL
jgi:homoserine kinase